MNRIIIPIAAVGSLTGGGIAGAAASLVGPGWGAIIGTGAVATLGWIFRRQIAKLSEQGERIAKLEARCDAFTAELEISRTAKHKQSEVIQHNVIRIDELKERIHRIEDRSGRHERDEQAEG